MLMIQIKETKRRVPTEAVVEDGRNISSTK